MTDRLDIGSEVEGYRILSLLHQGGNGYVYDVRPPPARDPGFPLVLKIPGIGRGQPTLGLVSFEIEQMIHPGLDGPHVPGVVASGEASRQPYLVMERIEGESLTAFLPRAPLREDEVTRLGAAIADALASIHRQGVIHLDLKPENVILRPNGTAVLLDFGYAHHVRLPDLLAEERHFAAGSDAYVSPEQLQGDRSDLRSDIFALGVVLYQIATGEVPFGEPTTFAGMKDRLWKAPLPPRALNDRIAPWLQEVILHCLEPEAPNRYPSAAHVAFDLRHPDQVALSERAHRSGGIGFAAQTARWWRTRADRSRTLAGRREGAPAAPIIMVAVDTEHPEDERHPQLQQTTQTILSISAEFRLMCVSVVRAAPLGEGEELNDTASGRHLEHLHRLRHWVEPMRLPPSRLSLHVVEGASPSNTLLDLAHANNVDLIVIGAPGPEQMRLAWWRSVASNVTANAHCSVHVVRVPQPVRDSS